MSSHIDFLDFKNILNKNNILLFDTQLRIAHYRYNQYIKTLPQIGGSKFEEPDNILIKINKKKNCLLSHFVDSLITNNLIKTNYIMELITDSTI
jgi:hypothetical protein